MGREHEIEINEVLAEPRRELNEAQASGQILKSAEKATRLCWSGVGAYLRDRRVGNKVLGGIMATAMPVLLPFAVGTSALEAALYKKPKKKDE